MENRDTGFQEIEEHLDRAMMPPARAHSSITSSRIEFDKRRLDVSEYRKGDVNELDTAIVAYLATHSSASASELTAASGRARSTVGNHLRNLVAQSTIEPAETVNSPRQRYRLRR